METKPPLERGSLEPAPVTTLSLQLLIPSQKPALEKTTFLTAISSLTPGSLYSGEKRMGDLQFVKHWQAQLQSSSQKVIIYLVIIFYYVFNLLRTIWIHRKSQLEQNPPCQQQSGGTPLRFCEERLIFFFRLWEFF